jgi:hypothetical protein
MFYENMRIVVYICHKMKSLYMFCGRITHFYNVKAGGAPRTQARAHTHARKIPAFMFIGYVTTLYDLWSLCSL